MNPYLRWIYLLVHVVIFMAGILLLQQPSASWQGVGSSLIAAGIAGWVVLAYVAMTQRVAARHALLEDSGILRVFPGRSTTIRPEYEERVSKAKEGIDVIGFGLNAMRQDFHVGGFRRWASTVPVRILLLDPEFPREGTLSSLRDQEERQPEGTIADEVRAFIRECSPLIRSSSTSFQVRLYRVLPSINYFRVDDEAFWGPYLMLEPSRNTPTLLIKRGGVLYERLRGHFDSIWSDEFSRAVPAAWLGDGDI